MSRPNRVSWCHPFLTASGYKMTWQLKQNDELLVLDRFGKVVSERIRNINRTKHRERLVNLITRETHTYIVDGAIVHNFSVLKGLRSFLHDNSITKNISPKQELIFHS